MRSRLRPRSVYDVLAVVGCFAALTTGGAYAAATIGSADVIDESLLSQDIRNNAITTSDLALDSVYGSRIKASGIPAGKLGSNSVLGVNMADNAVGSAEVADGSLGGADLSADAVTSGKVADGSLSGDDLGDGSVKGADVDESTLDKVASAGNADTVGGKQAGDFLPNRTYKLVGPYTPGDVDNRTGGRKAELSCEGGDILLNGGYYTGSVNNPNRVQGANNYYGNTFTMEWWVPEGTSGGQFSLVITCLDSAAPAHGAQRLGAQPAAKGR